MTKAQKRWARGAEGAEHQALHGQGTQKGLRPPLPYARCITIPPASSGSGLRCGQPDFPGPGRSLTAPLRRWWGTQALAQSGNIGGALPQTIKNWTQMREQCRLPAVLNRPEEPRSRPSGHGENTQGHIGMEAPFLGGP